MRSAMCAFAGTTGRIQTSKIWRWRATLGSGKNWNMPAREGLDVGVVAVVHAAHLADPLVQLARGEPVLAEPRAGHRERGEVGVGAGHVDREPEGDRGGARVLLEDLDFEPGGAASPAMATPRPLGSRGSCGHRRPQRLHHLVGRVAGDADGQVRARVHLARELPHVVERDGLDAGDGAERDVPVGRAAEDVRLQPLLAELLLVVRAQVLDQRVELRVLEPREVLVAEPGVEQLRQDDVEEAFASCRGG